MIRVLIERQIKEGTLGRYKDIITHAKQLAGHVRGYVSGEMLFEAKDPNSVMVLSIWHDEQAWQDWCKSPMRIEINDALADILLEPENIRIFH